MNNPFALVEGDGFDEATIELRQACEKAAREISEIQHKYAYTGCDVSATRYPYVSL